MSFNRPPIIPARHSQGLEMYHRGLTLRQLIDTCEDIERMHDEPDLTHEAHNEIAASGPSLIAGFADGLLEDIRLLAAARRGQRA